MYETLSQVHAIWVNANMVAPIAESLMIAVINKGMAVQSFDW